MAPLTRQPTKRFPSSVLPTIPLLSSQRDIDTKKFKFFLRIPQLFPHRIACTITANLAKRTSFSTLRPSPPHPTTTILSNKLETNAQVAIHIIPLSIYHAIESNLLLLRGRNSRNYSNSLPSSINPSRSPSANYQPHWIQGTPGQTQSSICPSD